MKLDEYCRQGEKADSLYINGKFDKAEKEYHSLLKEMHGSGTIDTFVVSKITLGLLLTYIKKEEFSKAFEIWTSDPEKNIFGIGIMGLGETFQVALHDTMVYYAACAYMYTLIEDEPKNIAEEIAALMESIISYAREKEPEMLPQIISNWKSHLRDIFNIFIPTEYTKPISAIEKEQGVIYPLIDIDLPVPAKWIIDWDTEEHLIGKENSNQTPGE